MQTRTIILLALALLLAACSPHPGTGVWKASAANARGIERLVVGFNGRANFTTTQPQRDEWHCFWSGLDKHRLKLDCTPSSNPKKAQDFILQASVAGQASLRQQDKVLAQFTLVDEDPMKKDKR